MLWDADQLATVCKPHEVVSLRRLFQLDAAGWPEEQIPLVNDKTLVVAGLESCIDALPPEAACDWLERSVYPTIVSFQREVAQGGDQASLVLWIVDHRRLVHQTSDDTYYWHCGTEYKGQQIPLSRCLFNGAHQDLQRVIIVGEKKTEQWVGLYHPRIS